jgi:hypothetical protein
MMDFQNVFPRKVASSSADPIGVPRNWRSELGIFWKDIEEAGSVARALRLRSPTAPVQMRSGAIERLGGGEASLKAGRWDLFRTLRVSIL